MENFRDPKCKHPDTQQYNARGSSKKITAIQSVCIRCGRLSKWSKTTHHTVGGGFEESGEAVVVDEYYSYRGRERVKRTWLKPGVKIRALKKERKVK